MAKRGRKPKPTGLKVVEGNPGKRALPENEPEFDDGEVSAPEWIDERPRAWRVDFLAEWKRITTQLESWGIIGPANQGLLEAICTYYATGVKAAKDGNSSEMRQAFEAYRKSLNECGLTPASKSRIGASDPKPKGKLGKYTA